MSGDPQKVEMAGHKPFSELRKDIDASPERLANVARERAEAEREAAVEVMADAMKPHWGPGVYAPETIERLQAQGYYQRMVDARRALDALLADGRWLLVHPDEMIRRDELVSAGWIEATDFVWPHEMSPEDAKAGGYTPVFRVRPAVEKENDQ